MGLKDTIQEDIKTAMKAKDAGRLSVLRMILSEIKYAQAQVNLQTELPEADVQKIVSGYQKKLTKSLDDYPDGEKRTAIVNEIKIVESYLPKKASESEITNAVDKILKSTADRNFGALMKLVMAELGEAGDARLVSQLLKAKIG
ncbi:MAG: GatB/YqeY domain-containing protein [Proteobacteria bacterium]|jgi:uncharacterized protein YqeY|nr:GatB/YqeY domain-containing protein [Pseudomonadota bacterium]